MIRFIQETPVEFFVRGEAFDEKMSEMRKSYERAYFVPGRRYGLSQNRRRFNRADAGIEYRIENASTKEAWHGLRATHILMEKAVALKVLHPSLAADDKIVARFTREAKPPRASRTRTP